VLEDRTPDMQARGFDFSLDYEVINLLGQTLFDLGRLRARQGRTDEARSAWQQAVDSFQKTLAIDSENVTAHHNLQLLYAELGEDEKSREHEQLHLRYKPDDNAQGRAERLAREKYPAANHAAEAVVKYPLQRSGAPGLVPQFTSASPGPGEGPGEDGEGPGEAGEGPREASQLPGFEHARTSELEIEPSQKRRPTVAGGAP
jgi:tetratricopeptide (TPR) repeat protein